MKTRVLQNSILAVILALSCSVVSADPITAILSLLALEKASPEAKEPDAEERLSWEEKLTDAEYAVLDVMKNHPAINSCISAANERNPIAEYHIVKIARFSAQIKQSLVEYDEVPDVESMKYQWPAKAFRWCGKQADTRMASAPRSLELYAYDIAKIVHTNHANDTMLASNSN